MPTIKDLYQTLGVRRDASEDEIRKQFQMKSLELHPDVSKIEGAEELFKELEFAYSILSKSEKRNKYDEIWRTTHSEASTTSAAKMPDSTRAASGESDWWSPNWVRQMNDIFGIDWDEMFVDYKRMSDEALEIHRGTTQDAEEIISSINEDTEKMMKEINEGAEAFLRKI